MKYFPYLAEQLSLVLVLSLSSPPASLPRLTLTLPASPLPPVWSEMFLNLTLRQSNARKEIKATFAGGKDAHLS